MKKCLFLMLMFVSVSMMGQSIKSIEDDPFEGTKVIVTDTEKLTKESFKDARGQSMFYFRSVGNLIAFHLLWQCRDVFIVSKGQKALFLMEDGSKITLEALGDIKPEPSIASTAAVKPAKVLGMNIPYGSKEILGLGEQNVTAIRIYTSDGYQDFNIDKKKQSLIKDCLNLLIKKMDIK